MYELRVTGYGGQGVIRTGMIIGKALSLYGGMHATLTQSFGPEARGSACSAHVVVSDTRILYPYVSSPHVMLALSHDGYVTHKDTIAEDCTLLYEEDLVKLQRHDSKIRLYGVPATRIAEELGRKIVLNIVMLGFFGAVTELIPREALRKAVETSVPSGTEELNVNAFDSGFEFGMQLKEKAEVEH